MTSTPVPPRIIDGTKLPQRAAVDAGVLMRALEPEHQDRFALACRDFWTSMLVDERREIIIPAPTFAEHLRKKVSRLPSTRQVYVVPFDRRCAELLADRIPDSVLKLEIEAFKSEYGEDAPGAYIKYDAMIVACAKFWGAQRIVSIDRHIARLAPRMPIDCRVPDYFYSTDPQQLSLPAPTPLRAVPLVMEVPRKRQEDGEN